MFPGNGCRDTSANMELTQVGSGRTSAPAEVKSEEVQSEDIQPEDVSLVLPFEVRVFLRLRYTPMPAKRLSAPATPYITVAQGPGPV